MYILKIIYYVLLNYDILNCLPRFCSTSVDELLRARR